LKKVRLGKLTDKEKENALNEVRILASIRQANVIGYKEAFVDEKSASVWYVPRCRLTPQLSNGVGRQRRPLPEDPPAAEEE